MAKTKIEEPTLTHNGTTYKVSALTEEAQKQLINVKAAENEIRHLQIQLAIAQTAHSAYEQALIGLLPS
jgi:catechol-2,3-dioxygenase